VHKYTKYIKIYQKKRYQQTIKGLKSKYPRFSVLKVLNDQKTTKKVQKDYLSAYI